MFSYTDQNQINKSESKCDKTEVVVSLKQFLKHAS